MTDKQQEATCREVHAKLCAVLNIPLKCPACNHVMDYHQWPCIDSETGDHLGDYQVFVCPNCDHKSEVSEKSVNA